MSDQVLVVRPEPGATHTAARLTERGFEPIVYPLFAVAPVAWTPPDPANFDAVLLTSANASRLAGAGLSRFAGLPTFVVGEATEQGAVGTGFHHLTRGGGDIASTLPIIAAAGYKRILHLGGEIVREADPGDLHIERIAVYRSMATGDAAELAFHLPPTDTLHALVHSPRAGERLSALLEREDRARIAVVAISRAAADMCGELWLDLAVADRPDEEAMLARLQDLNG